MNLLTLRLFMMQFTDSQRRLEEFQIKEQLIANSFFTKRAQKIKIKAEISLISERLSRRTIKKLCTTICHVH